MNSLWMRTVAASCLLTTFSLVPVQAEPATAKYPVCGLSTMGDMGFLNSAGTLPTDALEEAKAHPGIYKSAVIDLLWSQLEPTQGQFDFSELENALANIDSYNAKFPSTPLTGSVTVFGGPNAPAWAKSLDNGPVTVPKGLKSSTIGHFWSLPYRQAFQQLQTALAGQYDSDPRIQQIQVSSCSSDTAEPFVLDSTGINAVRAAGMTDANYQACLEGAESDYAAWKLTPVYFPFAPFVETDPHTNGGNPAVTNAIMNQFKADLGSRGVIGNNALAPMPATPTKQSTNMSGVYQNISTLGPNETFQFATTNATNAVSGAALGFSMGMTDLEVWDTTATKDGNFNISTQQLQQWAGSFQCPSTTALPCGSTPSGSTVSTVIGETTGTIPATSTQCQFGGTQATTTITTQIMLCTNGTLTAQGTPTSTTTDTGGPTCNAPASCGSTPSGSMQTKTIGQTTGSVPATTTQCPYGGTQATTNTTTQVFLCTNGTLIAQGAPTTTIIDTGNPVCTAPAACGTTPSGGTQTKVLSQVSGSLAATSSQCPYGGTQATSTTTTQSYLCTNGTLTAQGSPSSTTADIGPPVCDVAATCGTTPSGSTVNQILSETPGTVAATSSQCPYGGTQPTTIVKSQSFLCTNGNLTAQGAPVTTTKDTGTPTCDAPAACGSTPSGGTETVVTNESNGEIAVTMNSCPYGASQQTKTVTTETYLCINGTLSPQGSQSIATVKVGTPTCTAPASCGSTPSGETETKTIGQIPGSNPATFLQCIFGGTQPTLTVISQTYLCTNGTLTLDGTPTKTTANDGSPNCNHPIGKLF